MRFDLKIFMQISLYLQELYLEDLHLGANSLNYAVMELQVKIFCHGLVLTHQIKKILLQVSLFIIQNRYYRK